MNQEIVNKQLIVELERNIQKNNELDGKIRELDMQLDVYRKLEEGDKIDNETKSKAMKTGSKFYKTNTQFGNSNGFQQSIKEHNVNITLNYLLTSLLGELKFPRL